MSLRKEFRAGVQVLKGIDLAVEAGEVVVILGPSGSGKSTLIRCINGLETITSGSIRIEGRAVESATEAEWRKVRLQVGMVFQNYALFPNLSVLRNISLAPIRAGLMTRPAAEAEARRLLATVGLADKETAYGAALSGGQQQRVAICRALAMKPKAILFDEPTSALDPEMVGEVLGVMRRLAESGTTMICVTHEMGFARNAANRVVFMDQGEVVEVAPPEQFFACPSTERSQRFLNMIQK